MQNIKLSCHHLSARRANHPLFQALDFNLSSGELLQILGPNGAGKSTLLKLLAGLREPDEGAVLFQTKSIADELNAYQSQLAYLGHRLGLKLNLSVQENLVLINATTEQLIVQLKEFALSPHLATTVAHLSQGQKQRVALARICLSQKPIWILDEPFAALDQQGFGIFQRLLQQHLSRGGIAILSSHRALEFTQGVQTIYLEPINA